MADPFDVANGDPSADAAAAQGGDQFGPSFYRNLMNFGASTMVAANARTPQGFLQYGGGIAGPVGAGVLGAMEASRQNAQLGSQIGLRSAETQNAQQDVISKRIQTAMARGNYNFAAPFYGTPQLDQNGNPVPGTGGGGFLGGMGGQPQGQSQGQSQQPPQQAQGAGGAAPAGGDVASRVRGIEGGYGTQENQGGYAGAYQFGTAALADAGLYKPAPGEDVSKNQWQGTINVAPWQPMSVQQFAQNPQAQDVAFQTTAKRNLGLAQQQGLTQYLGQTVGGVPITQDSLVGMMHFGGVSGTAHFLQSGGQYNPADANGTTLSAYGQRVAGVSQRIAQQGQGQPGQGGTPQQQGAGMDSMSLARAIMGGQLQNPTPQQALAAAPLIARLPIAGAAEISKKLYDFGLAGPQAASVAQAQGANQTPPGFQRTPDGRMVPIQGGPNDPNYIAQTEGGKAAAVARAQAQNQAPQGFQRNADGTMTPIPGYVQGTNAVEAAKPRTLRGEGSAYIDPLHPENNIQIPVERTAVDPTTGAKTTYMVQPLEMGPGKQPLGPTSPGVVGSFPSGMGEGRKELVTGLGKDYVEESKKEYSSAMMTAGWAEQMDHAMDQLNAGGGWSVTGAGNPERMEIAKMTNSTFQTLGMAPPFDANKVASWEEFTKQTKTAGMQLVTSMFGGSREAASIINGATSAVPNSENTPVGGKLVLNGIKESSQYVVDRHIYETNWLASHDGSLIGAEESFNQQYSPAKYAKRAISQVQPYEVDDPAKLKAYLPGTLIKTPGGIKMVPGPAQLPLNPGVQ